MVSTRSDTPVVAHPVDGHNRSMWSLPVADWTARDPSVLRPVGAF